MATDSGSGGSNVFSWRALLETDLPLLGRWLAEPGVARWWNHESTPAAVERDFGPGIRGEEPGEDLIALLDGIPLGLVQRSRLSDYPDELARFSALVDVPDGAVELDYLIGDPSARGRGLGGAMVAAAVEDTWRADPDATAVFIAVVAANRASWRAAERAGLNRVAEGPMAPDNPIDDPLHYVHRIDRPR